MNFKDYLDIPDKSWNGIGRHLGKIVKDNLRRQGKTVDDLVWGLVDKEMAIPDDYVHEYIDGNKYGGGSFGVFFPGVQECLGIEARDIFRNGLSEAELEQALSGLHEYLTCLTGSESFVGLLKIPPGEQLRLHVIETLKAYRERSTMTDEDIEKQTGINPECLREIIYEGKLDFDGSDENLRRLGYLIGKLGLGIDQVAPFREPTRAERYEAYTRWKLKTGGYYGVGIHSSQEEALFKFADTGDISPELMRPRGPSEHEEEMINSDLVIALNLFRQLPKLISAAYQTN